MSANRHEQKGEEQGATIMVPLITVERIILGLFENRHYILSPFLCDSQIRLSSRFWGLVELLVRFPY